MKKFTFTQPISKSVKSDYFKFLISLNNGICYSTNYVRNKLFKYMTFQELREVGLITMQNGIYYITEKGKKYVSCVNQSKYTKNDLRNIIKG
jgi:hypothetical protein